MHAEGSKESSHFKIKDRTAIATCWLAGPFVLLQLLTCIVTSNIKSHSAIYWPTWCSPSTMSGWLSLHRGKSLASFIQTSKTWDQRHQDCTVSLHMWSRLHWKDKQLNWHQVEEVQRHIHLEDQKKSSAAEHICQLGAPHPASAASSLGLNHIIREIT
jgi:hypothetical protein